MRGLYLHRGEEGVSVKFSNVDIGAELVLDGGVERVKGKGLSLEVTTGWSVDKLVLDELDGGVLHLVLVAVAIAEVGSFVHVLPETVEWKLFVEVAQHFTPPLLGSIPEEIWENGVVWPYLTGEQCIGTLVGIDKHTPIFSGVVNAIISAISLSDASIDDWDELDVVGVDRRVDKIGESLPLISWGNGEILIVIHVVDVGPLNVKWQVVLLVLIDIFLNFLGAGVSPLALLPSKGPHRGKHWLSDKVMVSLGNVVWVRAEDQGDIGNTTGSDGRDVDLSVDVIIVDNPVLGVGQVGIDTKP